MKLLSVKIPKKIILASLLISFLAQAPNIYAWLKTPEGHWFSGFNIYLSPVDINTYLAAMRQGYNGDWLWQNRFTGEALSTYPVYIFYLFLGHLARWGHFSLPFVFHLSDFALSFVLLLSVYVFVSRFLEEKRLRYFCFFLVALGSGLGWAAPQYSPDAIFLEATVFPTLNFPHFVLNQIFFLFTLYFGFVGVRRRDVPAAVISTVSGFLLLVVHPYSLFVAGLVLGGYVCLSGIVKRDFWVRLRFLLPLLILSTISLAFFAYLFYFRGDPVLKEWMRQQVILSPPPLVMLLSYGLLSVLGFFGLRYLWERKDEKSLLLISWIVLHPFCIYLPVRFQLQMFKGFFIILCLLATFGIKKLTFLRRENIAFILFLSVVTTLMMQAFRFVSLEERHRLVYLTANEEASFSWIRQNVPTDSLFLSSYIVGNFIPAQTDSRSYFGHGIFTTHFDQKKVVVRRFYSGRMSSDEIKQFLKSEGVSYVYCGPDEKSLGASYLLGDSNLGKVYENEKVKIFKVL